MLGLLARDRLRGARGSKQVMDCESLVIWIEDRRELVVDQKIENKTCISYISQHMFIYLYIYIYKYVWKTEVLYEVYVFLYDWSMICLFVTHGSELECTKVCRLNAVWLSYQQGYRISLRVYQIFSRDTHLKCQPRMNKPWLVNIFLWTGGAPFRPTRPSLV